MFDSIPNFIRLVSQKLVAPGFEISEVNSIHKVFSIRDNIVIFFVLNTPKNIDLIQSKH